MKPCLFLDRDGVLIKDKKYLSAASQVEIIEEVLPLLLWAKAKDWYLIVVTNQSGVAKGLFTFQNVEEINLKIAQLLANRGISIDRWYVCPHHPNAKNIESRCPGPEDKKCRKPEPGLFLQALNDFSIDINKSIMIGDKKSDLIHLEGLTSYLIRGEYDLLDVKEDVIFNSFQELLLKLQTKI